MPDDGGTAASPTQSPAVTNLCHDDDLFHDGPAAAAAAAAAALQMSV